MHTWTVLINLNLNLNLLVTTNFVHPPCSGRTALISVTHRPELVVFYCSMCESCQTGNSYQIHVVRSENITSRDGCIPPLMPSAVTAGGQTLASSVIICLFRFTSFNVLNLDHRVFWADSSAPLTFPPTVFLQQRASTADFSRFGVLQPFCQRMLRCLSSSVVKGAVREDEEEIRLFMLQYILQVCRAFT